MSLATRRQAAVAAKLGHLRNELARWRGLTEEDGLPLARHWSQVEAVTAGLDTALSEIEAELGRAHGADVEVVAASMSLGSQLLDVHRAWEYFRSKLGQRFVAELAPYLIATDELAWECYRPAQEAAAPTQVPREPPLTFLSVGASPFMLTRGESIATALSDGGIRNERVKALVDALPVPVIGLPWDHLRHLPDAAVVAHEVGHVVEDDFGLSAGTAAHVSAAVADADRACAWRAWSSEVFADVYATLALGPAYADALADFVAGDRRSVVRARPTPNAWGAYPTPTLRVLVALAACRAMKHGVAADEVERDWRAIFPQHRLVSWEPDATAVAKRVVQATYATLSDRQLCHVIGFDPETRAAAANDAIQLLAGGQVVGTDVRQLVATARETFRRAPDAYASSDQAGDRILERIGAYSDTSRRRSRTRHARFLERQRDVDDRVRALLTQANPIVETEVA